MCIGWPKNNRQTRHFQSRLHTSKSLKGSQNQVIKSDLYQYRTNRRYFPTNRENLNQLS